MHRLAQPSQDGLMVPSQMMSFSGRLRHTMFLHRRFLYGQFCFLHRMHTNWMSYSTHRSPWDQSENYVPQSWMSHGVLLGRILPFHAVTDTKTLSLVFCCCVVRQSAGYQKVDCLLAIFSKSVWLHGWHLKLDIGQLTTGSWYSCCIGSTSRG